MPETPNSKVPMGMGDEDETTENLVAKFQTLSAEGDLLAQRGAFIESIDVFSRALEIRPADKHCLVARSKCYIHVGSPQMALEDANTSLSGDPEFFKGIFQKAEALYAMGDFELALMYYHRGNRLRPELDEFRIGIQKAREAIENSIGHHKDFKIQVPLKLRKNLAAVWLDGNTNQNATTPKTPNYGAGMTAGPQSTTNPPGFIPGMKNVSTAGTAASSHSGTTVSPMTAMMESKLLGELYDDKCYLQNLINDKDFVDHPDNEVLALVTEGLRYLNTRVEFWRQQNPLYARPKEKKIKPRMERGSSKKSNPPTVQKTFKAGMSKSTTVKRSPVPPISSSGGDGEMKGTVHRKVTTKFDEHGFINKGLTASS